MCSPAADPAAPQHARRRRPNVLLSPWLPPLLGLLCMASSLGNSFTYDDIPLVCENPRLTSIGNVRAIWLSNWWQAVDESADVNVRRDPLYRPLVLFTLAANYAADGLRPAGYHLVNVLLHALVCLLVWHFARRLTGDLAVASVAAALFAVHPIHSEAVAGVVGRAEVLAALFLLIGLLVLMSPLQKGTGSEPTAENDPDSRVPRGAYTPLQRTHVPRGRSPGLLRALLALPAFLAALLSKETAVCYPAVALLVLHACERGRRHAWRWWLMHAAVLALPLLLYFPLRYVALDGRLLRSEPAGVLMNPLVLAEGLERVFGALTVLGHYARLLLVPAELSCDYGLAIIDPRTGFGGLTLVGLAVAGATALALFGFTRRGPLWHKIATLTAITLASYILISNSFLLIGVSLAERLMYWPSIPVCTLIAIGVLEFWRRQCAPGRLLANSARLLRVLVMLFIVVLGLRAAVRNADWRDNLTLFSRDAATHPQGARLNWGCASELMKLTALADQPEDRAELLASAEQYLDRALRIDPAFADALVLRAWLSVHQRNDDQATLYAEAALRVQPHHPDALRLLARYHSGSTERRLDTLRADVQAQPDDPARHLALGRALLELGRPLAARARFEQALTLAPDNVDAQRLLGESLAVVGENDAALDVLQRVLAQTPDDWRVHANLSRLLADRDPPGSLRHAQRAHQLQPDNLQLHVNLAEARALNGQTPEALELFRHILAELDEDDPYRNVIHARIAELQHP